MDAEITRVRKLSIWHLSAFKHADEKLEKLSLRRDKQIKKAAKQAAAKTEKAMKKKAIEVKLSKKMKKAPAAKTKKAMKKKAIEVKLSKKMKKAPASKFETAMMNQAADEEDNDEKARKKQPASKFVRSRNKIKNFESHLLNEYKKQKL